MNYSPIQMLCRIFILNPHTCSEYTLPALTPVDLRNLPSKLQKYVPKLPLPMNSAAN